MASNAIAIYVYIVTGALYSAKNPPDRSISPRDEKRARGSTTFLSLSLSLSYSRETVKVIPLSLARTPAFFLLRSSACFLSLEKGRERSECKTRSSRLVFALGIFGMPSEQVLRASARRTRFRSCSRSFLSTCVYRLYGKSGGCPL